MPRKKTKEPTAVPAEMPTKQGIIEGDWPELEPYGVADVPMSREAYALAMEIKEGGEPAEEPSALLEAAKSGDRRKLLVAMRDRLAYMLDKTDSGRDVAAIARNLNIISKELDGMPDPDADAADPVERMRKKVTERQTR